jgi:hypothetical protein
MAVEDLNAVAVTGVATKPPTYDSTAWSFLEIGVRNHGSILYLVLHVPDRLRRTLYVLGPKDKVLARGELAFVHSHTAPPGQIVLKVHALELVTANGRVLAAAPGPSESHTHPYNAFAPTGERRRRRRGRRGAPQERNP